MFFCKIFPGEHVPGPPRRGHAFGTPTNAICDATTFSSAISSSPARLCWNHHWFLRDHTKTLQFKRSKVLVQNPTTYSAEKRFSVLVDIKMKKKLSFEWDTWWPKAGDWNKTLCLTGLKFSKICSSKEVINSLPVDNNKTATEFFRCCYLQIFFLIFEVR